MSGATLQSQSYSLSQSSNPLKAEFKYYLPRKDGVFPSTNNLELILGDIDQETRILPVNDIRAQPEVDWSKTLDTTGFAFVKRSTWTYVDANMTDEEIDNGSYPEDLEETIHQLYPEIDPDFMKIYHLSFIFRGQSGSNKFTNAASTGSDPAWNKPNRGSAPAGRVHIDFSRLGTEKVVAAAFGAQSEVAQMVTDRHSGRRMVCLSLWRPLKTVQRDSLAVCDARSVTTSDLVKTPRVWPDGVGYERISVKASGTSGGECKHRWHYMSDQTPEELCVVKICDTANGWTKWEDSGSDEDPIGCTPHCSVKVPGTDHMPVRESIEWRVVILMDNDASKGFVGR